MPLLELAVHEVIARDDWYPGKPSFVGREAVRFVVARVAEDVGDAEPVADTALGWQQVDSRAKAFERHVLGANDHGVPRLVEVFYSGVDPSDAFNCSRSTSG